MSVSRKKPRWEQVADRLDALSTGPTDEQTRVAEVLKIPLGRQVPAPVAAVVIRHGLQSTLFQDLGRMVDLPDSLLELEAKLGLETTSSLITGTRSEVSAWFSARYMTLTSRGLRELRPEPGDVVTGQWEPVSERVVSSVSDDGHLNFKGRPSARAWPNNLVIAARIKDAEYSAAINRVDAALRNAATYIDSSFGHFSALDDFALETEVPAPEAIRALEELLESGEHLEQPFQELLELYPSLLAAVVIGNWKTFVIPQPRLGAEHVPDFLVLGFNSLGPQWVTVEIEATRHRILNKNKDLSSPTRHAVRQIQDWREWLTEHVAYAQTAHHLHGLTNRAPGLVIIGRDSPSSERQPARSRLEEEAHIAVHSWDWLLRAARGRSQNPLLSSDFAVGNVERLSKDITPVFDDSSLNGDDESEILDVEDLFSGWRE